MKPLDQEKPLRPRLPSDHDDDDAADVAWSPYPRHGDDQPSHLACVFNSLCKLNELNVEAIRRLYQDESRKAISRPGMEIVISSILPRLQAWYIGLPKCVQEGQSALPHILDLQ